MTVDIGPASIIVIIVPLMKYCEGREEEDLEKLLYKFLRVVYSFSELKCLVVDELSGRPWAPLT